MISFTISLDWRLFGVTFALLACLGIVYNILVDRLGDRKEGYTSLLVVGGVLFTLLCVAILSWISAVIVLSAFVASGTPMIIGDIWRHVQHREAAQAAMRAEIAATASQVAGRQ